MSDWIDITKEKPIDGKQCRFCIRNNPKLIIQGTWSDEYNIFITNVFNICGPLFNITHWKYLNE
jgi:hypothetical protein